MGLFYVFAFVVPKFAEIFSRFDLKDGLPPTTGAIIEITRWLLPWGYGFFFVGPLFFGWLVFAAWRGRPRMATLTILVFGLVSVAVCTIALGVITINLFLPLVESVQDTNGAP